MNIKKLPQKEIDRVLAWHLEYLEFIKSNSATTASISQKLTSRATIQDSERLRILSDCVEIIMADNLSTGALSNKNQPCVSSATNGFDPSIRMPSKPIKNQSRRLHDTQTAPKGLVNEKTLEKREVFFGRCISPGKYSLKNLVGVYFYYDNTITIYEFSGFGDKRKEIRAWPLVQKIDSYSLSDTGFKPGTRITIQSMKFQIDHLQGYQQPYCSNLTSSTRDPNTERQRLDVLKSIKNSNRIGSIIYTLRYECEFKTNSIPEIFDMLGVEISDSALWHKLIKDLDHDGNLDSSEVIQSIFGLINIDRIQTIRNAWLKIDSKRQGYIERSLVERTSNLKLIDANILFNFLDCIGDQKHSSFDAFFHFYYALSVLIDSDSDFNLIFTAIWP